MHHHHAWLERLDDPARDDWQRPTELIGKMELAPGMIVADLGAGTGYFEANLSRAVGETGRVMALEVDPALVARMMRRFAGDGLQNVEVRVVTPSDPALAEGSVDRVLIVDVWHHQRDRVAYARRLRRALKPGGRVYVVDGLPALREGPPPDLRLSEKAVIDELVEAGLDARVAPLSLPRQFVVVGSTR